MKIPSHKSRVAAQKKPYTIIAAARGECCAEAHLYVQTIYVEGDKDAAARQFAEKECPEPDCEILVVPGVIRFPDPILTVRDFAVVKED